MRGPGGWGGHLVDVDAAGHDPGANLAVVVELGVACGVVVPGLDDGGGGVFLGAFDQASGVVDELVIHGLVDRWGGLGDGFVRVEWAACVPKCASPVWETTVHLLGVVACGHAHGAGPSASLGVRGDANVAKIAFFEMSGLQGMLDVDGAALDLLELLDDLGLDDVVRQRADGLGVDLSGSEGLPVCCHDERPLGAELKADPLEVVAHILNGAELGNGSEDVGGDDVGGHGVRLQVVGEWLTYSDVMSVMVSPNLLATRQRMAAIRAAKRP